MTVVRNIAANGAGAAAGLLVMLVAVPLYLRLLGAEAYGLVGVFMTVSLAALALDLGLGATLNRELARTRAQAEGEDIADLVSTLEAGAWILGLLFGAGFALAAPALTAHWLTFATLAPATVTEALRLMSVALPALVARAVYVAGLNGLQCQGRANILLAGGSVLRALVTLAALTWGRADITTFLLAQVATLYVEAPAGRLALRAALPPVARHGRIRPGVARASLSFAAGVAGTMLLALALTSVDQVVLSALLPLTHFGYYTLAVAAASALGQLVQPVSTAVFPRFSRLVADGDVQELSREYHFFSQLVAVSVVPAGALLAFFPDEVLTLWTGSSDVARAAAGVLALRAIGTALNALMHVPHVMQLAVGWSSLGAGVNAVALAVVVPATLMLGRAWGGVGAALVWVALNVGMLTFAMVRMHRRVLGGELARWYAGVLGPAVAVVLVCALSRSVMPDTPAPLARLAWLLVTGALAVLGALAAAGAVRRRMVAVETAPIG